MNCLYQSGWPLRNLTQLCDLIIGKTPSRENPEYWSKGEHLWLSIGDMRNGQYISQTKEKITDAGAAIFGKRLIKPDTVVLSFKLSIRSLAKLRISICHPERSEGSHQIP